MSTVVSVPPTKNQLVLLVVEDSDDDAQLITMSLARETEHLFDIHRAANLYEATAILEKIEPDVVLLDLNLGTSNGWPTFDAMTEMLKGRAALVISTGDGDTVTAAEAIRKGAQDFFVKDAIPVAGMLARVLRHAVERHVAAAQVQKLQMSLIRAAKLESIGHLAAGVAHEVKNPLQIIKLGLSLLKKRIPPDDEDAQGVVEDCDEAVDRARRIINGLLNFGHVQSLDLEETSIDWIINEACELVDHDVQVSRAWVIKELRTTPYLLVDSGKLVQVLVNCITNACHAMEDTNGGIVKIHTSVVPADEVPVPLKGGQPGEPVVLIVIEDNGPGIPEEILPKLFEAFTTTKAPGKGTGLGLPVCRMIMQLHGGAMEIGNRPQGQGSVVHLWLPLSPPPQPTSTETS